MVNIFINNKKVGQTDSTSVPEITSFISTTTLLRNNEFYLEQCGRRLSDRSNVNAGSEVHCLLRLLGGKGGFGSMLRAIGAQIEKTTNREACRDLSGRRLRDINEEKRLKAWLDKQGEREREAEERKKRKIEKLLAVPKHEFKDKQYDEARSKLTEKVSDSVEEGFKKVQVANKAEEKGPGTSAGIKRKSTSATPANGKKKKSALWIGDDFSDTDDSDDSSADEGQATEKLKNNCRLSS